MSVDHEPFKKLQAEQQARLQEQQNKNFADAMEQLRRQNGIVVPPKPFNQPYQPPYNPPSSPIGQQSPPPYTQPQEKATGGGSEVSWTYYPAAWISFACAVALGIFIGLAVQSIANNTWISVGAGIGSWLVAQKILFMDVVQESLGALIKFIAAVAAIALAGYLISLFF